MKHFRPRYQSQPQFSFPAAAAQYNLEITLKIAAQHNCQPSYEYFYCPSSSNKLDAGRLPHDTMSDKYCILVTESLNSSTIAYKQP